MALLQQVDNSFRRKSELEADRNFFHVHTDVFVPAESIIQWLRPVYTHMQHAMRGTHLVAHMRMHV